MGGAWLSIHQPCAAAETGSLAGDFGRGIEAGVWRGGRWKFRFLGGFIFNVDRDSFWRGWAGRGWETKCMGSRLSLFEANYGVLGFTCIILKDLLHGMEHSIYRCVRYKNIRGLISRHLADRCLPPRRIPCARFCETSSSLS